MTMTLSDLVGKNLDKYQQVQVMIRGSMEAISGVQERPGASGTVTVLLTAGLSRRTENLLGSTVVSVAEKPKLAPAATTVVKRRRGTTVVRRSRKVKPPGTESKKKNEIVAAVKRSGAKK